MAEDACVDGISILDAEHIIPLKMKVCLELKSKKAEGIHVNSRDIKKHRLDVFLLFQLVRGSRKITVPLRRICGVMGIRLILALSS